jgi:hypothetical protein
LAFAAQDIAGNLIAGLALATSDKFQEGDVIEVKMGGDQISGVFDDIGWLETVRGPDEVVVSPDFKFMFVAFQGPGVIWQFWRQDGRPFSAAPLDIKYHREVLS